MRGGCDCVCDIDVGDGGIFDWCVGCGVGEWCVFCEYE